MWARVKFVHQAGSMQWELTERLVESLPKVLWVCREFVGSSPKVIMSLPRRHREFVERRPRDLSEDHRGLSKSLPGWILVDLEKRTQGVDID
ncbi:hypothetical protein BHE74_00057136 [Ensete ventricosum]|nr:hypothetical protein BHE74_00057136 [Ensete ventricosum]